MIRVKNIFAIIIYCCVAVLSFYGPVAFALTDEPQTMETLQSAIEKVRVESGLVGLGISIIDKNGSSWVAGLGEADKANHKPVTQNTMFRIGSTSKMFVALSVLQLVEQGKLHLDDKLRDLAPEIYFENEWEDKNPVRLVHLLEHTTGWNDVGFSVFAYQDAKISLENALAFHPLYRKSRWVPGTRFSYNNGGAAVAAYIVQKVAGQPYEEYVQQHFFNPLQMTTATFFESEDYRQNGATLYSSIGEALPYWNFILRPAGAVNASTADMTKYLQFLIARGAFDQQRLLSEQSFTRMETPTTTLGAKMGTRSGYGLHNYVSGFKSANIAFHGHDGDISGGHCRLGYVPELKVGYVLMINQDNPQALNKIQTLIRAYLLNGVHKDVQNSIALPEKFKQLSGYYIPISPREDSSKLISDLMGVMTITASDNRLHRMPLFGGWPSPSNDYAINGNTLVSTYTGLPTIAVVNDPLVGEVVEVSDDAVGSSLKRVSACRVFGLFGLIACTLALSALSIVFAPIWIVRLIAGNFSNGAAVSVRLWPLLTSITPLIGVLTIQLFGSVETMGTVSLTTIIIFICTCVYAVLAVYSLINIYIHRQNKFNAFMYWHSAILSVSHVCMVIVLEHYNFLMLRLWA